MTDSVDAIRKAVHAAYEEIEKFDAGHGTMPRLTSLLAMAWMEEVRADWTRRAKHFPREAAVARQLCQRTTNQFNNDPSEEIVARLHGDPVYRVLGNGRGTEPTVPSIQGMMGDACPLWAHYLEDARCAIAAVEALDAQQSAEAA